MFPIAVFRDICGGNKSSMTKISVIVPIYKVEAYLNRCVGSILAQTYSDFELILVDDGSPDNCGKICDEYAEKDTRITVIHQENGGLSAARNAGIERALKNDSEWVSFIDSDDWIHPQYLEMLLAAAALHNTKIVLCDYEPTRSDTKIYQPIGADSGNFSVVPAKDSYSLRHFPVIPAWAKIYHKSLMKQPIRFPEGKINEDRFTTYKWIFSQTSISLVHERIYYYYLREDSIMRADWSPKRMDDLEACREQLSFFEAKSFPEAQKIVAKQYLMLLKKGHYASVSYPKEHKQIKKAYNTAFDKYKDLLSLSVEKNPNLCLLRHPIRTKLHIRFSNLKAILRNSGIKGILRKIKTKLFPSEHK